VAKAFSNGIELEYDSFGNEGHEAFVLVSGLGVQMIRWSDEFCTLLADRGYRVVRFDNRDVGLSSSFSAHGTPNLEEIVQALSQGRRPEVAYTLLDMAADVVGLLDFLGIDKVHVAGRSLGGMVAQLFASLHPGRTLSLTSIMSSTGNPSLPPPGPEAMAAMTRKAPHPHENREGYLRQSLEFSKLIESPRYPTSEADLRAQAEAELERSYTPGCLLRQIAALAVVGDIRRYLHLIQAPTLVIHGRQDPLITVESGEDTARNIRGARLWIVEGMGHDFPRSLYPEFAQAMDETARRSHGVPA